MYWQVSLPCPKLGFGATAAEGWVGRLCSQGRNHSRQRCSRTARSGGDCGALRASLHPTSAPPLWAEWYDPCQLVFLQHKARTGCVSQGTTRGDHLFAEIRLADTFTLNFPVRLRGVATHYCSRKQRLHPAHHWTRRRYPAKL